MSMNYDTEIDPEEFSNARMNADMTQKDVADYIGCGLTVINNLERAVNWPTNRAIRRNLIAFIKKYNK